MAKAGYTVVEFLDEGSVQVVPYSWTEEEGGVSVLKVNVIHQIRIEHCKWTNYIMCLHRIMVARFQLKQLGYSITPIYLHRSCTAIGLNLILPTK